MSDQRCVWCGHAAAEHSAIFGYCHHGFDIRFSDDGSAEVAGLPLSCPCKEYSPSPRPPRLRQRIGAMFRRGRPTLTLDNPAGWQFPPEQRVIVEDGRYWDIGQRRRRRWWSR